MNQNELGSLARTTREQTIESLLGKTVGYRRLNTPSNKPRRLSIPRGSTPTHVSYIDGINSVLWFITSTMNELKVDHYDYLILRQDEGEPSKDYKYLDSLEGEFTESKQITPDWNVFVKPL